MQYIKVTSQLQWKTVIIKETFTLCQKNMWLILEHTLLLFLYSDKYNVWLLFIIFLQNCDIDYFGLLITKLTKPYKCDLDIFARHRVPIYFDNTYRNKTNLNKSAGGKSISTELKKIRKWNT